MAEDDKPQQVMIMNWPEVFTVKIVTEVAEKKPEPVPEPKPQTGLEPGTQAFDTAVSQAMAAAGLDTKAGQAAFAETKKLVALLVGVTKKGIAQGKSHSEISQAIRDLSQAHQPQADYSDGEKE